MAYYNSTFRNIEGFTQNKTNYILLGDSVLNNSVYVPDGSRVAQLLQNITKGEVLCLAKNNAVISSVYGQITKIPDSLKTNNTKVLLSVGGNNILNQDLKTLTSDVLKNIFSKYTTLVDTIQSSVPNLQIVVFDVYCPDKYHNYYDIVKEWNTLLYNYVLQNNLKINLRYFYVSSILTSPDDFTNDIEVSAVGGQKIIDSLQKI
jgi:hypothetical protein